MKLLFDQNLSHRLIRAVADVYPDCEHVRNVGLKNAPDTEVWNYAKSNGFTIVSKDSDFHQRSLLLGYPPKVIWVKLGNCSAKAVEPNPAGPLKPTCSSLRRMKQQASSFCPERPPVPPKAAMTATCPLARTAALGFHRDSRRRRLHSEVA